MPRGSPASSPRDLARPRETVIQKRETVVQKKRTRVWRHKRGSRVEATSQRKSRQERPNGISVTPTSVRKPVAIARALDGQFHGTACLQRD